MWRGTVHLVQNNTTIILPCATPLTTSELPGRTSATHFWRQKISLETKQYFRFFIFYIGFSHCKSLLVKRLMQSPVKKSCLSYIDVRTVKLFPPAESWSFKVPARQPYARQFFSDNGVAHSIHNGEALKRIGPLQKQSCRDASYTVWLQIK